MKVNLKKTLVICNGANAKRLLTKVWRAGRLPPLRVTTRDLGVDATQACYHFQTVDESSAVAWFTGAQQGQDSQVPL
eukprot:3555473-Amphidinium_carterae.1